MYYNLFGCVNNASKAIRAAIKYLTFCLVYLAMVACETNVNQQDPATFMDTDKDGIADSQDPIPNSSPANVKLGDMDGDAYFGDEDVDDDGNGLIEIHNAAEFSMIRNNLAGTSFSSVKGSKGNSDGCGGGVSSAGNPIAYCNGYELMADISLSGYSNWQPIGGCSANNLCDEAFSSIFDGNNHIIRDLTIDIDYLNYGVGLFGAISPDSEIRNVHLRNAEVTFVPPAEEEAYDVGMLIGHGRGAMIVSSSVVGGSIYTTAFDAAALVGDGEGATIKSSYANIDTIRGPAEVGVLIGGGDSSRIISSCGSAKVLEGVDEVGGLIGDGGNAFVAYSYASVDNLKGEIRVGDLAGEMSGMTIKDSHALNGYFECVDHRSPHTKK